jgi:hypothetical protein
MERANRLELSDLQTQQSHHVMDTPPPSSTDTATVTPGQELTEIIAAWTKLPPEIRTAVLDATFASLESAGQMNRSFFFAEGVPIRRLNLLHLIVGQF